MDYLTTCPMKHLKKLMWVSILVALFLLCACSQIKQPTVDTPQQSTPIENPTPTLSPTETPTLTPDTRIEINRKNFPDSAFRNYVLDNIDKDYDEKLSEQEIESTIVFNLAEKNIEDLTGIEFFTYATELHCQGNQITRLELTDLSRLRVLNCADNRKLSVIDFGKSISTLEVITINKTIISSLPLTDAKKLKELNSVGTLVKNYEFCSDSPLKILNCSGYDYDHNLIIRVKVDISGCTDIQTLECEYYTWSNNTNVVLELPHLQKLYLSCGNLVSIDLTGCPELKELCISDSSADTKLKTVIAKNLKKLNKVEICGCNMPDYGSPLKLEADFSGCENLTYFNANDVKKINLTGCNSLDKSNFWYDTYDGTKVVGLK